ncbi:hypothetical protein KY285_035769 [Solanum tuberosum]|nr:hypothetical protein KY285_035769 [Solanum tuberosum]
MEEDQWQTQKKKNFRGYPQNNQRNHQNNQQNQVYKPVPHQNQTSKEPQKVLTQCSPPLNSMVVLQSPPPVLPLKFIRTIKARMPTISKNLSPVLIEDIDHAAEDSLDYESMEGPELGHSDDEGEVNSGRVEVNALVQ